MTSESHGVLSTDRKVLTQLEEKAALLRTRGLTRSDKGLLKNRLNYVWGEVVDKPKSATTWRNARARRAYDDIQAANDHIFLAVVLIITPTQIGHKSFENVIEDIVRLESYDSYRLNLSTADRSFFESVAAEYGFAGDRRYVRFMRALFPQTWGDEPRRM